MSTLILPSSAFFHSCPLHSLLYKSARESLSKLIHIMSVPCSKSPMTSPTLGINLSKNYTIWPPDTVLVSFTFLLLASLSLLATSQTRQALSYLTCFCYPLYLECPSHWFFPGSLLLRSLPRCHFAEVLPDHPVHHGTPEHTVAHHLPPCFSRYLPLYHMRLLVYTICYIRARCFSLYLEQCLAHS